VQPPFQRQAIFVLGSADAEDPGVAEGLHPPGVVVEAADRALEAAPAEGALPLWIRGAAVLASSASELVQALDVFPDGVLAVLPAGGGGGPLGPGEHLQITSFVLTTAKLPVLVGERCS